MRLISLSCCLALLMALGCSEDSDPKGADPCFSQCEASVLTVECGTDAAADCDTGNRCYTSARGAICIAEGSSDGDAEGEMDRRVEVSDCFSSCKAAGNGGAGGSAGAGGAGGGAGVGGGGPVELEEHVRLSYTKTTKIRETGMSTVDMVVFDFDDQEEFNLTQGRGVVDCSSRLCRLNRDMNWIGWLKPDQVVGGFKLMVAPVDLVRKTIKIDEAREINDRVNHFEFTTFQETPDSETTIEQVVYSRGQAMGLDGMIDVWAEPVAGFDAAECEGLQMEGDHSAACRYQLGTINISGGFRVTSLGALVILIEATLANMTLSFYNLANGRQATIAQFGPDEGTGSQFSDRNPISLSPNAEKLAVVTSDEFMWRLHTLPAVPNPPPALTHDLFEAEHAPDPGDCVRMGDYNFNEVRYNPVFSSDGEWIYFLAHGDCSRRGMGTGGMTNRDDFDILRINQALEGVVENVTRNTRASHWSNHNIGDFALSPDDSMIVFTSERPNKRESKSIWVIDPETGDYNCTRGPSMGSLDPNRPECEYIFDDRMDADVKYQSLRFHKVMVPRN